MPSATAERAIEPMFSCVVERLEHGEPPRRRGVGAGQQRVQVRRGRRSAEASTPRVSRKPITSDSTHLSAS